MIIREIVDKDKILNDYSLPVKVLCLRPVFAVLVDTFPNSPLTNNINISGHEGCYGVDLLVHKVDSYGPSAECWDRCKLLGAKGVTVAGGYNFVLTSRLIDIRLRLLDSLNHIISYTSNMTN